MIAGQARVPRHAGSRPGACTPGRPRRPGERLGLERDVVARADGRRLAALEVRGVRGNVRARRDAVAATLVVSARAEELHGVGDDLDSLALAGHIVGLP